MNKIELRESLKKYFNESELRSLCFDLSVSYDALSGSGLEDKTRELVGFMERRGKLNKLIERLLELRPNLPSSDINKFAQGNLINFQIKQDFERADIVYLLNIIQHIMGDSRITLPDSLKEELKFPSSEIDIFAEDNNKVKTNIAYLLNIIQHIMGDSRITLPDSLKEELKHFFTKQKVSKELHDISMLFSEIEEIISMHPLFLSRYDLDTAKAKIQKIKSKLYSFFENELFDLPSIFSEIEEILSKNPSKLRKSELIDAQQKIHQIKMKLNSFLENE
ncbi:MAG: hypothetical protein DWQ04_33340 [Chloroflexi bacterium]|nr:MAG: hypothetical protein DWQ04_33340 [Chloroflexota bacterium]